MSSVDSSNTALAAGFYTEPIQDRNVPAYFQKYTVQFVGGYGEVSTSFIGLIPCNLPGQRVLSVECSGTLHNLVALDGTAPEPDEEGGRVPEWVIQFDVSDIQIFPQFELQYGLEGTLTLRGLTSSNPNTITGEVINASMVMTYSYDRDRGQLLFHIDLKKISGDIPPAPQTIPFSFAIMIQDDLEPPKYVRPAYANQRFPYQYTGEGQTILVPSLLESGYLYSDIIAYLSAQGITKTNDDLDRQIKWVNVTQFETFYWDWEYYTIPASDGRVCEPPLAELRLGDADNLTCTLEFLLSIAPDANILIAYYGCNCDPNTGELTSTVEAEMELIQWIRNNANRFDLICDTHDHLLPSKFTEEQLTYFQDTFTFLYQETKMLVTSSGDFGIPEPYLYNVGVHVFSVGGSKYVQTSPDTFQQVGYSQSSGGFYSTIDGQIFPAYQVGLVEYPGITPANMRNAETVGVPTCCGLASGLVYVFNGVTTPMNGTENGVRAITALFALINEATDFTWRYLDVFYADADYVTDYIDKGQNNAYNAQDFVDWNPITGLGAVDGQALLNMVIDTYVRSGDRVMIYNTFLQTRMASLCMFPPTPFYDSEVRQPVFGPQCYWSYLVVYRILEDGRVDTERTVLEDGDTVAFFSSLPFNLYWVMVRDASGYVKLQRYENVVQPEMTWTLELPIDAEDSRVAWYSDVHFHTPTEPKWWLSCRSGATGISSSPCLYTEQDATTTFRFRRHTWFVEDQQLYIRLLAQQNEYSYYVNISNAFYYMTSGYNQDNYAQGRQLAASFEMFVKYGDFSPYPEMLMIPVNQVEEIQPETGQLLMFYNIRVQAFVRIGYDFLSEQTYVLFYNPNSSTCDARTYAYEECVFMFEKPSSKGTAKLFSVSTIFGPTFANSTSAKFNSFVSKVIMYKPKGYFDTPLITVGNKNDVGGNIDSFLGLNTAEDVYLFHVQSNKMMPARGALPMWIRQVLYPNTGYPNGAIYPNAPGTVNLPFMGPYNAVDVANGDTGGSWRMQSKSDFDSYVLDPQLQAGWFITVQNRSVFSFDANENYIVNFPNSPTWQPQMLAYDGQDPVGHWRLIHQMGPLTNYVYTGCMYNWKNVTTNLFISTIMNLQHTPSMLDAGPTYDYPQTFLCLYTQSNDGL